MLTGMRQRQQEHEAVKTGFREEPGIPNRTGIPDRLKAGAETVSGFSFDDVRIHYSSGKPKELYAHAFTQGNHVYIAPGREDSLPHELGHVIQQKRGTVRPTFYLGQIGVNDEQRLEREADRLGMMAQRQTAGFPMGKSTVTGMGEGVPVQMEPSAEFGVIRSLQDYLRQQQEQRQPQRGRVRQNPEPRNEPGVSRGHQNPVPQNESVQQGPVKGYPLMVYETFGAGVDELVKVYRQSCQYPGRTICIFGINKRYRISEFGNARLPEADALFEGLAPEARQWWHQVYVIPFKWKSVGGNDIQAVEDNAAAANAGAEDEAAFRAADERMGYTLPYYEVRGRLMEEARRIIGNKRPGKRVLFRWIDRDAGGDTSGNLNAGMLSRMARGGMPQFLSGSYDWRITGDSPLPDAFLAKFNDAERKLRAFWYELNRGLASGSMGFYMPEPVLIMNREAHERAMGQLANEAARKQHLQDRKQDKESKVAFSGDSKINIKFIPAFSVSKPNKTLSFGGGKTYLQELEDIMRGPKVDEQAFSRILSGLRQSAFDNGQWFFLQGQYYNEWYNTDWEDRLQQIHERACNEFGKASQEVKEIEAQRSLNQKRSKLAQELYNAYNPNKAVTA